METYELLQKALRSIEVEERWCQHLLHQPDTGALCAVGALNNALAGTPYPAAAGDAAPRETFDPVDVSAYTRAINVLCCLAEQQEAYGNGAFGNAIAVFNNTHSHAEVVALFQEAIRNEKAKAGVQVDVPEREALHV